ncbi:820_t:CDS:2 [Funneliformis geosporum]|uniref:17669_t:CDS:1 n=1 Tax=Funneliformis geosporum TaxID=1117311 RepID=A0A9W4X3T8_9GLOM|nr:820_t:CDS:2 [Funneliformis geosporum]CAI2184488.1 17669_t:CDS:2 [Funneliformis geosporum]
MSEKVPFSLLRNPISFVSSRSLQTVANVQSEEEDRKKLAENITKFYQSVISLPTKNVRKGKIKTLKRQGIINKKSITNNTSLKDCFSLLNNKSSSESLERLLEYNDEDVIIKHNDKNDKKKNVEISDSNTVENDEKLWCVDCGILVEKILYQSHIHGTAHLVISKSLNDQSIPDPLALNETNVGFRMLRDQGWRYEKGLGVNEQGRRHPIPTRLKNDRLGIGVKKTNQPPKIRLKRLNAKQTAEQYEKDRKDKIRMLAYMNR